MLRLLELQLRILLHYIVDLEARDFLLLGGLLDLFSWRCIRDGRNLDKLLLVGPLGLLNMLVLGGLSVLSQLLVLSGSGQVLVLWWSVRRLAGFRQKKAFLFLLLGELRSLLL